MTDWKAGKAVNTQLAPPCPPPALREASGGLQTCSAMTRDAGLSPHLSAGEPESSERRSRLARSGRRLEENLQTQSISERSEFIKN